MQIEQVDQVTGWSDYYHIHLTRVCTNLNQVLFNSMKNAHDYFALAIVERYQAMIQFYGEEQNKANEITKIIFQNGFEDIMIRKFLIRPVAFFDRRNRM